jgi:gamma-glutamylcyclotransferase (GGCT)/AIG2-like uncharacterized protein YtfP
MTDGGVSAQEQARAQQRLAVYGTLAPGRENAWMLASLHGTWCEGQIRGRRLSAGWGASFGYLGVQLDPDGELIDVQVFESSDLPAHWEKLDAFEGTEYERAIVAVETQHGTLLACVYVIAQPKAGS